LINKTFSRKALEKLEVVMNPYIVAQLAREREMEIRREMERLEKIRDRRYQANPEPKPRKFAPAWVLSWLRREPAREPC
jgi:hypothetical protein